MAQEWKLLKNELELIDQIILELKNELQKFLKSNQFKKIVFDSEKIKHEFMKKIGPCYFPDCENQSVSKSHSISNKLMLQPISEDSHVVTPTLDGLTGKYIVESLGLKKATVFPGFCEQHENEFQFENNGLIKTEIELQKHLFRTICYQLHFLKSELIKLKEAERMFHKYFDPIFELKIEEYQLKSHKPELLGYFSAIILPYYELRPRQIQEDIDFLIENWYEPHATAFGYGLPEGFYSEIIGCTVLNKLALSCPVIFPDSPTDSEGTPDFDHEYFVMVFPNNGTTHIYLVCLEDKKEKLITLAELFERDGDKTTDYLFNLMKSKTENWFLAPSTWEKLSEDGKNYLLQSLSKII